MRTLNVHTLCFVCVCRFAHKRAASPHTAGAAARRVPAAAVAWRACCTPFAPFCLAEAALIFSRLSHTVREQPRQNKHFGSSPAAPLSLACWLRGLLNSKKKSARAFVLLCVCSAHKCCTSTPLSPPLFAHTHTCSALLLARVHAPTHAHHPHCPRHAATRHIVMMMSCCLSFCVALLPPPLCVLSPPPAPFAHTACALSCVCVVCACRRRSPRYRARNAVSKGLAAGAASPDTRRLCRGPPNSFLRCLCASLLCSPPFSRAPPARRACPPPPLAAARPLTRRTYTHAHTHIHTCFHALSDCPILPHTTYVPI